LTGGDFYCAGQSFNPLELVVSGTPNYTIYYNIDGDPQVLSNVSSSPVVISIGNQYGVYDLDSITDAYCTNIMVGSQTIAVNEAPTIPILGGDTLFCKDGNVGEIFPVNITNGAIRWYGNPQLTDYLGSNLTFLPNNQTTTTYYATHVLNDCESPAGSITITIEECPFIIPTAFTPNDDGVNDYWNIIGLDEKYPLNRVSVYNRWGESVYESLPGAYNQKPWDGKFKGKLLPVSSYYYVIKLSNESSVEPLNGTVSIILKK
jgi:gliding motility-associated-like protein